MSRLIIVLSSTGMILLLLSAVHADTIKPPIPQKISKGPMQQLPERPSQSIDESSIITPLPIPRGHFLMPIGKKGPQQSVPSTPCSAYIVLCACQDSSYFLGSIQLVYQNQPYCVNHQWMSNYLAGDYVCNDGTLGVINEDHSCSIENFTCLTPCQ